MDAAQASLEKASLDLGYTRVTAPIAGLTGRAQRKVGDLVGKGEPTLLTTISSIDPIRVSVNIPEALFLRYADRINAAASGTAEAQDDGGAQLVLADGTVYSERGRLIVIEQQVVEPSGQAAKG